MSRLALGIAGAFIVAALMCLSLAPAASATRYDFDITKTIKGYTIHVAGWVDFDRSAKIVTAHIHVTVTDPSGTVIFDKVYDLSYSWTSTPPPVTLFLPGAGLLVTIVFASMGGIAVTAAPVLVPAPLAPRHHGADRAQ